MCENLWTNSKSLQDFVVIIIFTKNNRNESEQVWQDTGSRRNTAPTLVHFTPDPSVRGSLLSKSPGSSVCRPSEAITRLQNSEAACLELGWSAGYHVKFWSNFVKFCPKKCHVKIMCDFTFVENRLDYFSWNRRV